METRPEVASVTAYSAASRIVAEAGGQMTSPALAKELRINEARAELLPESTIIIEYLARYFPGRTALLPTDPDVARRTRLLDRFYDCYVMEPMQKIVGDRLRAPGQKDAFGVAQAKAALLTSYGVIEKDIGSKSWALAEGFTMADCSAAPALFYVDKIMPLAKSHKGVAAYLDRLMKRPSYARVLKEAEPYFKLFPKEEAA